MIIALSGHNLEIMKTIAGDNKGNKKGMFYKNIYKCKDKEILHTSSLVKNADILIITIRKIIDIDCVVKWQR